MAKTTKILTKKLDILPLQKNKKTDNFIVIKHVSTQLGKLVVNIITKINQRGLSRALSLVLLGVGNVNNKTKSSPRIIRLDPEITI